MQIKLKAFERVKDGKMNLDLPAGWKAEPKDVLFHNKNKGDEWTENFMVTPINNQTQNGILGAGIAVAHSIKRYIITG